MARWNGMAGSLSVSTRVASSVRFSFNRIIPLSIWNPSSQLSHIAQLSSAPATLNSGFFSSRLGAIILFRVSSSISGDSAEWSSDIHEQATVAIEEADLIVFVCDVREQVSPKEKTLARTIRNYQKPVVLGRSPPYQI